MQGFVHNGMFEATSLKSASELVINSSMEAIAPSRPDASLNYSFCYVEFKNFQFPVPMRSRFRCVAEFEKFWSMGFCDST